MIAQVYVDTDNLNIDKPFDYLVPKELEGEISVGARVKVPFGGGNMPKEAYVTLLKDESSFESLKSIKSVTDSMPVLTKASLELCFYMRKRYFCTFSEAARLMLPPGINMKFEEWILLSHGYLKKTDFKKSSNQELLLRFLTENDGCGEFSQIKRLLGKSARTTVNSLIKKGICEKSFRDKRKNNEKFVRVAFINPEIDFEATYKALEKRAPAQAKVLELLSHSGEMQLSDIVSITGTTRNAIESLYAKNLILYREVEVLRSPINDKSIEKTTSPTLTAEQKQAVKTILDKGKGTFLIHGVTGSGKTEVYLNVATEYISRGKQVIVLVPEISLTPQMTNRFYGRFGDKVAVIHSALSMGERLDEWNRIRRKSAQIIVGARSAIFAPCESLGAIIIDEEHEQTYKSESSPKYHASDIAAFLSEKHNCPLILASATPSVESYYKAEQGIYNLIELENRFNNNPLPEVTIADMRLELREGNKTVLSRTLANEMQKNIQNGEQTILFLNRRGYSTFVSCRDCGYVFSCPSCSVSLTYHKKDSSLTCHYCGYKEDIKSVCPQCKSIRVRDFGKGTQKAQEQIEQIFPAASSIRMDMDTTSGKNSHERLLDRFDKEKIDILLGTQMVTKGLDFENVTLVGVLAADSSLNVDDFRAQERTFDLITQVCGRAGRGKRRGRAVVQTYSPDNPTLLLAAKQDYKSFYKEEIAFRREFLYPPFCDIVNIVVSSADKSEAHCTAEQIAMKLSLSLRNESYKMFGPSPAPIEKLQGRYRFRIWMKCKADEKLIEELKKIIHEKYSKKKSDITISADINPYNMS